MTVKELKEILDACNDDAVITISIEDTAGHGSVSLEPEMVWARNDGLAVVIDPMATMDHHAIEDMK